jgi:hypothetical protein
MSGYSIPNTSGDWLRLSDVSEKRSRNNYGHIDQIVVYSCSGSLVILSTGVY